MSMAASQSVTAAETRHGMMNSRSPRVERNIPGAGRCRGLVIGGAYTELFLVSRWPVRTEGVGLAIS